MLLLEIRDKKFQTLIDNEFQLEYNKANKKRKLSLTNGDRFKLRI